MRLTLGWLVPVCFFSMTMASAAAFAATPAVDCQSAARDLNVPFNQFIKPYLEGCVRAAAPVSSLRTGEAALDEDLSVHGQRRHVADVEVNFDTLPEWSDAEIMQYFVATRDDRYLVATDRPDMPRRISWLYPDDGCYARAEQLIGRVSDAGMNPPHKLWAFGDLRVYTSNYPSGVVGWVYHVVPIVKNSAKEPVVLDAAISPCKPLPWKTWLGLMVDDMSTYDLDNDWNGVAVSDEHAYGHGDLAFGQPPTTPSHRDMSLQAEQENFLLDHHFDEVREWGRQVELDRDPFAVLGSTPPWSGSGCTFTEVTYATVDIAAGDSASAIATCPFATLNVGGGFMSSTPGLLISKNARLDNGWEIAAKNTGAVTQALAASAVCLTGAPTAATVSTVTGTAVSIPRLGYNSSTAACSSGVLVGGGYSTTVSGTPPSIMRIYNDGRTTSTGSTWQVSAYNTTGSSRSITPYAYCLNGTSFSASQTSGILHPEGIATAFCPSPLQTLGGGFVFPRSTNYYVATMNYQRQGHAYDVDMLPGPANPDPNAKAYGQCLYDPAPPPFCTEETATDMGAEHSTTSARGNSCLKITRYPGSWVGSVIVQAQANGSGYPIPFTWTHCTDSGNGSITGDWTQYTLRPATSNCTTVIDLNGASSARVSLTWWANG
jgi:hypothetical protein